MADSWNRSEMLSSSEKQIGRSENRSYQMSQLFRSFDVGKGIMHCFLGRFLSLQTRFMLQDHCPWITSLWEKETFTYKQDPEEDSNMIADPVLRNRG